MKIIVSDMNCKNCAEKIKKTLFMHDLDAEIDLADKSVNFDDVEDAEAIKEAIIKAGYTPTE
ncbi:MAG: heavy metal-associated domain-containing protein [Acholeplasmataceae bacterium]